MFVNNIASSNEYQLQRSLRFRASASAFLNRTPATATNRRTFTWSGWVKRGALGQQRLMNAYSGDENNTTELGFDATNNIVVSNVIGGSQATGFYGQTSGVFRDPSAWYHIVFSIDTTQATAVNALRVFVNGVLQTFSTSSYGGGANHNTWINNANVHRIGQTSPPNNSFFDGYLADVHFIDGQALTPTSFGQFDINGNWQAKPYTGTYGTNGFRLDFNDPTSTTTLMLDRSGNGNNWTANNISLTAGATYDSMLDVPLGGGGGERGNYATLNPLNVKLVNGSMTVSNGNLTVADAATTYGSIQATQTADAASNTWWEITCAASGGSNGTVGIKRADDAVNNYVGGSLNSYGYYTGGNKVSNSSSLAYGASYTTGDVIGVHLSGGVLTFYKQTGGTGSFVSQGSAYTGLTGDFYPAVGDGANAEVYTWNANFGQRPFNNTSIPSGAKALHTGNLPAPAIANPKLHFDVITHSGNGGSQTVNGSQFQPDFVWIKSRNIAENNALFDSARGVNKTLYSNLTNVEATDPGVSAFNSNGFSLSGATGNNTTYIYVDWLWKAGGAPVTNNAGSISAQVSANPVAGFSIVTYTGTGANATVGHGLGVAPRMVVVKSRSGVRNWQTYHASIGNTNFLYLNLTNASAASAGAWNNTTPTSSAISIGTLGDVNANTETYVAYCFSEIPGFSKIGSYTGNGSADGPFVHCGFRPRYVMVKSTNDTYNWFIYDTARGTVNVMNNGLMPNDGAVEQVNALWNFDILSNGFKPRGTNGNVNGGGNTYIFIAFAEAPFKYANAR